MTQIALPAHVVDALAVLQADAPAIMTDRQRELLAQHRAPAEEARAEMQRQIRQAEQAAARRRAEMDAACNAKQAADAEAFRQTEATRRAEAERLHQDVSARLAASVAENREAYLALHGEPEAA